MEGRFAEKTLPITMEHYEKAKEFINQVTQNYYEVITKLGRRKDALRTQEEPLERIYRLVASTGSEGIKQSDLLKKSHLTAEKLEPLLKTLIDRGDILRMMGEPTKGRRPVLLKANPKGK